MQKEPFMLYVRSLVFILCFYLTLVTGTLDVLLFSSSRAADVQRRQRFWLDRIETLMRLLINLRCEIRGRENIPEGPAIFAAAHQSIWDALFWPLVIKMPAMVYKNELMKIPLFGSMLKKMGSISVGRDMGASALRGLLKQSRTAVDKGYSIVIFPTGTRTPPGVRKEYKPGIAALYHHLDIPCVPVSINLGAFWPRHELVRRPGVFVISIGKPILPGLKRPDFMAQLEQQIETENERLLKEAGVSPATL